MFKTKCSPFYDLVWFQKIRVSSQKNRVMNIRSNVNLYLRNCFPQNWRTSEECYPILRRRHLSPLPSVRLPGTSRYILTYQWLTITNIQSQYVLLSDVCFCLDAQTTMNDIGLQVDVCALYLVFLMWKLLHDLKSRLVTFIRWEVERVSLDTSKISLDTSKSLKNC